MRRLLAGCWVLFFSIGLGFSTSGASADNGSRALHLRAATVDTRTVGDLRDDAEAARSFSPEGHHVIQLDGPITRDQERTLARLGILTSQYLPDNAYLVELTDERRAALAELDFVAWIGQYENAWKLDPEIGNRLEPFQSAERIALAAENKLRLTVTLHEGADLASAMAELANSGLTVQDSASVGPQGVVIVDVDANQIGTLVDQPFVQFVEEAGEVTYRNSTNRWIVQSNVLNSTPLYDNGLHGENQLIGILDGQVDVNHCSFSDTNPIGPTHRKIEAYNASLGSNTHGTHVAGTCVGDNGVDNNTRGVAYLARFVYDTTPSFSDTAVYNVLEQHHNQGARIHTNSWGDDGTTSYNGLARGFDRFSYDYEDSLVCLAVTNTSTLRNPENAKDLLACGASQDTPNQASHCSGGVGPTADGRRKPELYAPGCSTQSSAAGTSCSTQSLTGTSMATPAIAGTGLLIRQYYEEGFYPSGAPELGDEITPTGALIKATLLNSAADMTGISGYPSNLEGWGRVLADDALYFDGDTRSMVIDDVRNANGLATGEENTLDFTLSGSGEQLRVTLVFTDPPGTAGSSNPVVNNLDLEVTDPSGANVYLGNVFSAGASITGGSADAINNVEQVHVNSPTTGLWSVKVKGTAVTSGTQGYALVITGEVNLGPAAPVTKDVNVEVSTDVPDDIVVDATDVDLDPLDVIITSLPANGTLSDPGAGAINSVPYTLVGNGLTVTYLSNPGYAGNDSFTYKANDGNVPPDGGDSNTSTVSLFVIAAPPVITTASLPNGSVGNAYGPVQLLADFGQPPLVWELVTDVPYLETDLGTSGFAEVGIARNWHGDDIFRDYTLPFIFNFYGVDYDEIRVWSNGMVDFLIPEVGSGVLNSVATLIKNGRIAPLWDDLVTSRTAEDIFIDESVSNEVTIRWKASTYNGAHPCQFSLTMYADGAIDFHYGPGNSPITATVGISAGDETRYTISAYDPATNLGNVNSVRFKQPDQLSPGLSVSSTGELAGTPLEAGEYLPRIRVTDSLGRTDEVFLTLSVLSLLGDVDGDGDIDADDFVAMIDCMTGPNNGPVAGGCEGADMDADDDVDLEDATNWMTSYAP